MISLILDFICIRLCICSVWNDFSTARFIWPWTHLHGSLIVLNLKGWINMNLFMNGKASQTFHPEYSFHKCFVSFFLVNLKIFDIIFGYNLDIAYFYNFISWFPVATLQKMRVIVVQDNCCGVVTSHHLTDHVHCVFGVYFHDYPCISTVCRIPSTFLKVLKFLS